MGTIKLEGMEFFSFHGCFREEQIIGTRFLVDLAVTADTGAGERSDHLRDTVDYSAVYSVVKREMGQKSHLLEHVAWRILEALRKEFPELTEIGVRIAKVNPPMGGKMAHVSYETRWVK
jgi:7,8-dihydroneopterin aldolase/epimerase/oxygenase